MLRPSIPTSLNGSKALTIPDKASNQSQSSLESLLYEKVQRGEDVSPVLQALNYFRNTNNEEYWLKILKKQTQERLVFESAQRVLITAFAILGMIVFFAKVPSLSSHISNQTSSNIQQPQ